MQSAPFGIEENLTAAATDSDSVADLADEQIVVLVRVLQVDYLNLGLPRSDASCARTRTLTSSVQVDRSWP